MNPSLHRASVRRILASLLVAACLTTQHAAQSPITHETLWTLPQVQAPALSPDGRLIVFSVTQPAYDEKDESSDLWIATVDRSTPPRRLTTAKGTEAAPAWSPDGKRIAFTAKRTGDEQPQVYLLDLGGGEAARLTTLTLGARQPAWSPDGRWLLFQSGVHAGARNDEENQKLATQTKSAKAKVRIYDAFPTRFWDRWLDDVRTHLFVVPADGSAAPRDLLAGTTLAGLPGFRGAYAEGGTDNLHPTWKPDSSGVLFVATTNAHEAAHTESVTHLFDVGLNDTNPRQLTSGTDSSAHPRFSPDGRFLYFLTSQGHRKIYALSRLARVPWPWTPSTRPELPLQHFDRSVQSFTLGDRQTIYFTADDSGFGRLYRWSAGDPDKPALLAPSRLGAWGAPATSAQDASGRVIALWESATSPQEIHLLSPDSDQPTPITQFTTQTTASLDLPNLREFWFTNRFGRSIHNFIALPPAFDPAKKYPLLVLIHGGHASMWKDAFIRRWNYHLLAAPGYVVLLTDYTGSTGYGEGFTLAIQGDPLRGPANDINAAADEAIARFPFIDARLQAAAGASYGGHLANWLQGTTDRYKCLISHAGLASLYAQWSTSDGILHRERMLGGVFWENPKPWLDQSPITYAANFKTPMLLSIGENDFRVPLNNTLEMWSVLQRQQVPSRLLIWPNENHWISKGENSRVFYREVHAWLARWLK